MQLPSVELGNVALATAATMTLVGRFDCVLLHRLHRTARLAVPFAEASATARLTGLCQVSAQLDDAVVKPLDSCV